MGEKHWRPSAALCNGTDTEWKEEPAEPISYKHDLFRAWDSSVGKHCFYDSSANLEWHVVSISIILSEVELSVYLCSKLSYECDNQYKLLDYRY